MCYIIKEVKMKYKTYKKWEYVLSLCKGVMGTVVFIGVLFGTQYIVSVM